MKDSTIGRPSIAAELGSALEYGGLVLHYQPIVDLGTGATVGAQALVALLARGIRVALDDFGTRSSLGHLHDFPIDSIKVDRSVIGAIGFDETKIGLVRSIAAFALGLGLDTVAEGIETTQQRDVVTACGYRYAQGYLFAEPLNAAAFGQSLERIAAQPIS